MALSKVKKEEVVAKVTSILNEAKSVVFLNFHGLNVEGTTKMRRELSEKGISYIVAKKSLARRAITDSAVKVEGEIPSFEGELAIAYGEDETAAAREIYAFVKAQAKHISIQGGVFGNRLLGKEKMLEIAQIPGMLELRGMFVNLINSPIQRFAIVLNQIAQKKA